MAEITWGVDIDQYAEGWTWSAAGFDPDGGEYGDDAGGILFDSYDLAKQDAYRVLTLKADLDGHMIEFIWPGDCE